MKKILTILLLVISISAIGQLERNKQLLLFDGLYETKCYFEKGDDEGNQDYLRFYPNGKVISVGTDCEGTASDIKGWFNLNAKQADIGDFKVNNRRIKFSVKGQTGTINYRGRIINSEFIKLKWKSLINGSRGRSIYKFVKVTNLS